MTSVVPSSASRANVRIGSQDIHELPFPFVSPLGPEHDRDRARVRHYRLWEKIGDFPKGFVVQLYDSGLEADHGNVEKYGRSLGMRRVHAMETVLSNQKGWRLI